MTSGPGRVLFIPEEARLSQLVYLPEKQDLGAAVDTALGLVETANPELAEPDLDTITQGVVDRIRVDAELASKVADQLGMSGQSALRTVAGFLNTDGGALSTAGHRPPLA